MRLRTLINRLVWLGLAAYLGYAAVLAASSYVLVLQTVEQAVTDAAQRQKTALATGRPTGAAPEQAADVKAAILLGVRRTGLPIGEGKLVVKPEGEGLRISLHWSCVVLTVADEVAFAVPLWMDRTFDVRRQPRGSLAASAFQGLGMAGVDCTPPDFLRDSLAISLTFLVAAASFHWIEQPMLRIKRRLTR